MFEPLWVESPTRKVIVPAVFSFFLNDKMIEAEFQVNMAVLNSFPNDKMIKPEFQVNQIRKLTPFIKLRTI